jgi:hypothetical protein
VKQDRGRQGSGAACPSPSQDAEVSARSPTALYITVMIVFDVVNISQHIGERKIFAKLSKSGEGPKPPAREDRHEFRVRGRLCLNLLHEGTHRVLVKISNSH